MHRNVVRGRYVENVLVARRHFALIFQLDLNNFLNIKKDVYEEFVCSTPSSLFPIVLERIEPILCSNLLGTPIEFSLSTLCDILDLPNEGDLVYLTANDRLPIYGKIESEVYSFSRLIVSRAQPPISNLIFRVISKWFIKMLSLGQVTTTLSTFSTVFSIFSC